MFLFIFSFQADNLAYTILNVIIYVYIYIFKKKKVRINEDHVITRFMKYDSIENDSSPWFANNPFGARAW